MKYLAVLLLSGKAFTMCDGGPVPVECCEPGDRLDVIVGDDGGVRCADMGGDFHAGVCFDVDF